MTTTAETRPRALTPWERRWRSHDMVSLYDITQGTGLGLAGLCARISDHAQDPGQAEYWDRRFDLVEDRVEELNLQDRLGLLIQCDAWEDEYKELMRQHPAA